MSRRRCTCLEDQILVAFKQAMTDGRLDVAEHLPRALETPAPECAPGSSLARAYLSAAGPITRGD